MTNRKYAILVIDMQKDFWSEEGLFARKGFDVSEMQKCLSSIKNVIIEAKKNSIPVIYVRAEYGKDNLPENIWERYKQEGLKELCLPKSEGAKFYGIDEELADVIFVKHRYDAFTNPELEKYLQEQGITTIVLIGGSSDVCVDSTARTGFQKGFYIVAIKDCLVSLGNKQRDLEFYKKYYGARITNHKDFLKEL